MIKFVFLTQLVWKYSFQPTCILGVDEETFRDRISITQLSSAINLL